MEAANAAVEVAKNMRLLKKTSIIETATIPLLKK